MWTLHKAFSTVRETEVALDQMINELLLGYEPGLYNIKTKQVESLPRPKSCEQGHRVCIVPPEDS